MGIPFVTSVLIPEMERLLWCQSRISPPNLMNLLAETRKLKHSGKYWLRGC